MDLGKKEEVKEDHAIFNIEGIDGKSKIKIIPIGKMALGLRENVPDKLIAEQVLMKEERVAVKSYACNILDRYLMGSKTQPILYVEVLMERSLRTISLCRIYLDFEITSVVRSSKELLGRELAGQFKIRMVIGGTATILETVDTFPGTVTMVEHMVDFLKDEDMMEILNDLIMENNKEQEKKYNKEFGHYSIPENRISLRDYKLKD